MKVAEGRAGVEDMQIGGSAGTGWLGVRAGDSGDRAVVGYGGRVGRQD